jgi:plasma kallikrein
LGEKCIPYYLCQNDSTINTDGSYLIDERADGEGYVPKGCPILKVCCKKNKIEQPPPPPTVALKQSKCGFSNKEGLGRDSKSMQGTVDYAKYAEFPWMVAVLKIDVAGSGFLSILLGGGSLIHPKIVLTTAHNVDDYQSHGLKVRAGEWNTQSDDEISPYEERNVVSIIKHPQFVRKNLQNDISMLVMKSEFPITAAINTVCLPPPGADFSHQRCLSSGWGKKVFGKKGIYQAFLKKVELPVINSPRCQDQLRLTRFGPDFILHNGFLCAGE